MTDNFEKTTKKWLSEEIKFIILLGTMLTSIIFAWNNLETAQKIATNELVHVQAALNDIILVNKNLSVDINDLKIKMSELTVLLNK